MSATELPGNSDDSASGVDFATLDDGELKSEIHRLTKREREISFQRRFLHGQIEVARAELLRRLSDAGPGPLSAADVEELDRILDGEVRVERPD